MASSRTAEARAAAVSRALRKDGWGVAYSGQTGGRLAVDTGFGNVMVTMRKSPRADRAHVIETLVEAGYTVTDGTPDADTGVVRTLFVTREGWT